MRADLTFSGPGGRLFWLQHPLGTGAGLQQGLENTSGGDESWRTHPPLGLCACHPDRSLPDAFLARHQHMHAII